MNGSIDVTHTSLLCENCPTSTYSIDKNQLADDIVQHIEHYAPVLAEDITHGLRKARVNFIALPLSDGWYALRKFGESLSAALSWLLMKGRYLFMTLLFTLTFPLFPLRFSSFHLRSLLNGLPRFLFWDKMFLKEVICMHGYPISLIKDILWLLLSDSSSGFSDCPQNIANVLRLVKTEFEHIFGADVVNSHPMLYVCYAPGGPITFRSCNLIYLSSSDTYYLQHIYQFAHELCHFMVPSEVCAPYRWLEETLCEMMSWFILRQISLHPEAEHIFELGPLYSKICGYIEDSQAKRDPAATDPISSYISSRLSTLQGDCYDRSANASIAYALLPLFIQYPALWHIVPHLCELSTNTPLSNAIDQLCKAASVEETWCNQLRQTLCQ